MTMEDQEGVDRVVERFNGFEFSARTLVVNIACALKKNCPLSLVNCQLEMPSAEKSRRFAFVTMEDQEGVDRMVERFNGFEFLARALVVNIARALKKTVHCPLSTVN